jgi:hypothetical protein
VNVTQKILIGLGVAVGGVWAVNTYRQFSNGGLYVGKPKITRTEPHTISFQNILSNLLFPKVFATLPFQNITNINVHFKGAVGKMIAYQRQADGSYKEKYNLGSFIIGEQAKDILPNGMLETEVKVELIFSSLTNLITEGIYNWTDFVSSYDIRLKGVFTTTLGTIKFEESMI